MADLTPIGKYYTIITDMMTTKELAGIGGVTVGRICALCQTGVLKAHKIAGAWFIEPGSAKEWAASSRKVGRPPKEPRHE